MIAPRPARIAYGSLLLFFALLPSAQAQRGADPLTADQEEQVRAVADQPNERVKLFQTFIEQRTDAIHRIARHPETQHPGTQIHDQLEQFTSLVDELEDNLDAYEQSHDDIRKSLKVLLEHSAKWPGILNEPPGSPDYDFARKTALDAVASLTQSATELQKSQEIYFAKHKPGKERKANPE